MKKSGFLVCLVVGFLGLLAAVLDFVAEAKRVRDFKVIEEPNSRINFPTCGHPKSHSVALGITSALVLLVAEVVVIAAAGCVCCCGSPYQSTVEEKEESGCTSDSDSCSKIGSTNSFSNFFSNGGQSKPTGTKPSYGLDVEDSRKPA